MTRVRLVCATAFLLALGAGGALAHADLESAEPAPETRVGEPPAEVRLHFSEAVELDFSVFQVHELDSGDVDGSEETAWQRLNGRAAALVAEVLGSRGEDVGGVHVGIRTDERRSDQVVIELVDDLVPGYYVVMWRVLSVDTHAGQGFFVFEYSPQTQP